MGHGSVRGEGRALGENNAVGEKWWWGGGGGLSQPLPQPLFRLIACLHTVVWAFEVFKGLKP